MTKRLVTKVTGDIIELHPIVTAVLRGHINFAMGNLKPYAILLKAVKIGEKYFGKLLVIHQIRQSFLLPMFFTICLYSI